MNVLVTGATGHLGRSVVHALASAGHRVVAASRAGAPPAAPFGAPPTPAGLVSALAVDLGDEGCVGALEGALAEVDAVAHLGGWHPPSTASSTAADRARLLAVNVLGTMRLLEAVKRAGRRAAVVYSSSFEVYGAPEADPVGEDHPTRPLNDYGVSKLSGEDHLVAFAQEEGVRAVALRMPALYGPGETTPRALPLFLRAAARGEAPVIHGDGSDERDLLYVADAAASVRLALEGDAEGIFNVADGERHSIAELARAALEAAGLALEPSFQPRQKPLQRVHLDTARARDALGFRPAVSLREGARAQLAWLRATPQR